MLTFSPGCQSHLNPDMRLVSFDITTMFASEPTEQNTKIINEKIRWDSTLIERTKLSPAKIYKHMRCDMITTYFTYEATFIKR